MIARSHMILGACAWIAAAPLLHAPLLSPIGLAAAVFGALLPDIDHPQSWVGRRTRPVSSVLARMLGHRGVTHSAFAVIGLTVLLQRAGYDRRIVSALAVGYLSHLAADLLTPRGLRLLWPLRGSVSLPLCRTGSMTENLIVLALAGGLAWWRLHLPHWR